MLHQPTAHFQPAPLPEPGLNHLGEPIFDAAAYIDAMRALGATLHPVRGKPGAVEMDGTYTIEPPVDPAMRKRVEAVDRAFAPQRAADSVAVGRIAQRLFCEAATTRFATAAGDWATALRELARLKAELEAAAATERDGGDDADDDVVLAADVASEEYESAFEHVLAMPVRRPEDLVLKAEFALRFCDMGGELKKVLADIASFGRPELAGTFRDVALIAA